MTNIDFQRLKEHSEDNLGSGTEEELILRLEKLWGVNFPKVFRKFINEIGYAEIFGDEIYSIYEVPDLIPCSGLHWMNMKNEELLNGFIEFFSNDIDGVFYIHNETGKVYLNSTLNKYSETFIEFYSKLLDS